MTGEDVEEMVGEAVEAVEEIQDGRDVEEIAIEDVAAPHLAAVQDLYEEAMARIAGLGTCAAESRQADRRPRA